MKNLIHFDKLVDVNLMQIWFKFALISQRFFKHLLDGLNGFGFLHLIRFLDLFNCFFMMMMLFIGTYSVTTTLNVHSRSRSFVSAIDLRGLAPSMRLFRRPRGWNLWKVHTQSLVRVRFQFRQYQKNSLWVCREIVLIVDFSCRNCHKLYQEFHLFVHRYWLQDIAFWKNRYMFCSIVVFIFYLFNFCFLYIKESNELWQSVGQDMKSTEKSVAEMVSWSPIVSNESIRHMARRSRVMRSGSNMGRGGQGEGGAQWAWTWRKNANSCYTL